MNTILPQNNIRIRKTQKFDTGGFFKKFLIWIVSAIISFIPIVWVALLPILIGDKNWDTFWSSTLRNSDVMYACIALTVVAISDTVWEGQVRGVLVKVVMMFQVVSLILGCFAYTSYKTYNVRDTYMGSINGYFLLMILGLNVVGYIALSIKESKEIR